MGRQGKYKASSNNIMHWRAAKNDRRNATEISKSEIRLAIQIRHLGYKSDFDLSLWRYYKGYSSRHEYKVWRCRKEEQKDLFVIYRLDSASHRKFFKVH